MLFEEVFVFWLYETLLDLFHFPSGILYVMTHRSAMLCNVHIWIIVCCDFEVLKSWKTANCIISMQWFGRTFIGSDTSCLFASNYAHHTVLWSQGIYFFLAQEQQGELWSWDWVDSLRCWRWISCHDSQSKNFQKLLRNCSEEPNIDHGCYKMFPFYEKNCYT